LSVLALSGSGGDHHRRRLLLASQVKLRALSERNVELHRRLIEAFNARDIEAFIALCDPQIELHSAFAAVGGAVYHGHGRVRGFFQDMEDVWGKEIRSEPEAFFDLDEHTVVFSALHGSGRHSGVEVAMPTAQVARWHDGIILSYKSYGQREDALRDLGVSEDALEPIAP
jgi:ketosteroid isomerase-like protein